LLRLKAYFWRGSHAISLLAEEHGKTAIMASHDPKAVEKFKKVYNMRDGNFV